MEEQKIKEKKTKKQKEKKEHSLLGNYWYLYKGFFRCSRWYLLLVIMCIMGEVGTRYVWTYIPKIIVSLVMEQATAERLFAALSLAALAAFLLSQMSRIGYQLISNPGLKYRHVLERTVLHKICSTSYSDLEDPAYKTQIEHAQELYQNWNRDARACIWASIGFCQKIIMIPISSGLLMTLHPVVVAVLAAGSWLQYRVGRSSVTWETKFRDCWTPLERKTGYISEKLSNMTGVKDLRIYGADKWLMPKLKGLLQDLRVWRRKSCLHNTGVGMLFRAVEMGKQGAAYAFLIWGVLEGRVGADDFVLYLGLLMALSADLSVIADMFTRLRYCEVSIADYRRMLDMPDSVRRHPETAPPEVPAGEGPEIVFSHVSYSYPGAEEAALQDVDARIRPGEKVALVGLNGAGKTTLIKLLCGMYEPTQGKVFLNGHASACWDLESWYRLFSVVFQDIEVLPATIAENVAACAPEEMDREKVRRCLGQAGLLEMAEKLPQGIDTRLPKEMFSDGINLSGGETQKLLLARAIYREAPILILDEPTAAMDAIAENRLYLQYSELTRGRTSLFISHRLSSTQFCDTVWMMDGGRIIERGSHEELMEKKGAYYQLFQVQSHYYQNDRTEEFTSEMDPAWEVSGYVSE